MNQTKIAAILIGHYMNTMYAMDIPYETLKEKTFAGYKDAGEISNQLDTRFTTSLGSELKEIDESKEYAKKMAAFNKNYLGKVSFGPGSTTKLYTAVFLGIWNMFKSRTSLDKIINDGRLVKLFTNTFIKALRTDGFIIDDTAKLRNVIAEMYNGMVKEMLADIYKLSEGPITDSKIPEVMELARSYMDNEVDANRYFYDNVNATTLARNTLSAMLKAKALSSKCLSFFSSTRGPKNSFETNLVLVALDRLRRNKFYTEPRKEEKTRSKTPVFESGKKGKKEKKEKTEKKEEVEEEVVEEEDDIDWSFLFTGKRMVSGSTPSAPTSSEYEKRIAERYRLEEEMIYDYPKPPSYHEE
jgi:hypothetical protein